MYSSPTALLVDTFLWQYLILPLPFTCLSSFQPVLWSLPSSKWLDRVLSHPDPSEARKDVSNKYQKVKM